MNKKGWTILIAGVLILCCCASVAGLGIGGYLLYNNTGDNVLPSANVTPSGPRSTRTTVPPTLTPRPLARPTSPTPAQDISGTTSLSNATDIAALAGATLPPEDLRDLAVRFKGVPEAATPSDVQHGRDQLRDWRHPHLYPQQPG